MMTKAKLVTALFNTRAAAEGAVDAIIRNGYTREDISVVMTDEARTKHFALETGTQAAEGAGIGSALGGAVGAVLGAIAAVGSNLVLPGLGLVIAGPIAAGLAGLGAGGATGGLIGALIGAGVPEHRAKAYEPGLKAGGILIGVEARTDHDAEMIEKLLAGFGGEGVKKERMASGS
jgi:hypothetical protein